MTKTKLIKTLIIVMLIIPVILFVTGIIQTFVIKSKQKQLSDLQNSINASKEIEQEYKEIEDYMQSDEYQNNKDKSDDIIIDIQTPRPENN